MTRKLEPRLRILILWAFVIPAGFTCKFYQGPLGFWVRNYAAGLLYEVFWILGFFLLFPKRELIGRLSLWVFVLTSFLELLQLYQTPWIEKLREPFLGKVLLGTTFSWWDFPHYAAGCLLAVWLLERAASEGDTAGIL